MTLDYLIFDYSEDDEGTATWDAMATVRADRWPALEAEVLHVLCWADHQFPQQRGAIDEGAAWDFDLSTQSEQGADWRVEADLPARALRYAPLDARDTITLTLTLSGRGAFADAFARTFEVE